ncbi:TIGR03086 family protein [Asanoa ishikariensis]|uniref:TIGR03086 family protein n=1 Tax=Asanoa ishikariensis TaxID=137265 RepID=A0A1H3RV96_9ACTN|nr:TIGR03086 family metal-binding protein [Asanoa ishikariensis]GIF66822.1 TIGR03086 family protein [Asanoa ishikariensis]SDZ29191.1 TIGR03086 family protein [Asanoa ishikariensis]
MELTVAYQRALRGFADQVARIRPDQWSAPTPCTDWTVRDLVNHLVYEDRWSVPLINGASLGSVGSRFEGDLLGADPVGAAQAASAESVAAVRAPGALSRTVELSFGMTPAEEYVRQLLADHVVHGWDIASATDQDRELDDDLVREVAAWFPANEDGYRDSGAIAEAVEVPTNAPSQDKLIAAFGRNPRWISAA